MRLLLHCLATTSHWSAILAFSSGNFLSPLRRISQYESANKIPRRYMHRHINGCHHEIIDRRSVCHRATSSSEDTNSGNNTNNGSSATSFESLGLSNDILYIAERMNWHEPTAVQQLSIPAILDMAYYEDGDAGDGSSSSLWCEGPTGSGKTGGFALPLLQIILQEKKYSDNTFNNEGCVKNLILCPTRELAAQTHSVMQRLTSHLPNNSKKSISIDVIYGGVPIQPQVSRLAKRRKSGNDLDVLVATPGRLIDVLKYYTQSEEEDVDPTISALERRIIDALDEKSMSNVDDYGRGSKRKKKGRGRRPPAASSLSLNEIQEMDLDRVDDDGRGTLDEILHGLNYLVLDEADRLLGGAFKEEMDELLSLFPTSRAGPSEDYEESTKHKLKTLLFSATFPEQIEERVDRVLSRMSAGVPLRVSTSAAMLQRVPTISNSDEENDDHDELSNRQKKHIAHTTPIRSVLPDTAPKIQHRVIRLDERDRTQALRYLLGQNDVGDWDRVLVFVSTRYSAEHVSRKLRRYGISAAELHGKLDQEARERRLKSFRSGKTRVLISTDLAARGIDVEKLPVVVNYDLPRSVADFTHRTGRTGRAGKSGSAVSFISAKSEAHFNLIEERELLHMDKIERETLPDFAPNEEVWKVESAASTLSVPGAVHSQQGLAHDKMHGGIKGRRKSKKDKLREAAAKKAAQEGK